MSKKNITSLTSPDHFRGGNLPTRFNTSANYVFDFEIIGYAEHPCGESLTVPNQSFSVQELLHRHLTGSMPGIGRDAYYETDIYDDDPFSNVDPTLAPDFDLADAITLRDDISNRQTALQRGKNQNPPQAKASQDSGTGELVATSEPAPTDITE